jgi:hypothetical protein
MSIKVPGGPSPPIVQKYNTPPALFLGGGITLDFLPYSPSSGFAADFRIAAEPLRKADRFPQEPAGLSAPEAQSDPRSRGGVKKFCVDQAYEREKPRAMPGLSFSS